MDELLKGIAGLYAGSGGATLRGLTSGGMWLGQVPQQKTGVWIAVVPIAAPVEFAMNGAFTQECSIQFSIATLGSESGSGSGAAADIAAAMGALRSLYDWCAMSMTGRTLLSARRTGEKGPILDETTYGYIAYMDYVFMIGG